jgi:hypothetical protein
LSIGELVEIVEQTTSRRTLQDRLRRLVAAGHLERIGGGRSTRYRAPAQPLARSTERSAARSRERSAVRSAERSAARSLERSPARSAARSPARSLERSAARSSERSAPGSTAHSTAELPSAAGASPPTVSIESIPQPSRAQEPDEHRPPAEPQSVVPLSPGGLEIQRHLRTPAQGREPAGFQRELLEAYRPGETFYLPAHVRAELRRLGTPGRVELEAGTYARRILDRLLIDLSWSSSRLEGNTYSVLDTRRLLAFRQEAEGKARWEAQMLLNHKDAIEFLVDSATEIRFDRPSILNLHALLASDLLPDPAAGGRLRHIEVGIGGSTYLPLAVPQLIEECFDQLLYTAEAIADPFEQALFAMVHLPYLQPFEDVNKRVSRLAANIPFLRANLCPLSFTDVPRRLYQQAILGVYELRRIDLLRDVFLWAYRRSATRFVTVRQSLGEPDPFRLEHRESLRALIADIIRSRLPRREALAHLHRWTRAQAHLPPADQERLAELAEIELLSVHEGNFARFRVRPSEYHAWREVW